MVRNVLTRYVAILRITRAMLTYYTSSTKIFGCRCHKNARSNEKGKWGKGFVCLVISKKQLPYIDSVMTFTGDVNKKVTRKHGLDMTLKCELK